MNSPNSLYTLINYEINSIASSYLDPVDWRPHPERMTRYHWPLGPAGYTGKDTPNDEHNEWFSKIKQIEARYHSLVNHLNSKLQKVSPNEDFDTISVDTYNRKFNVLPPYQRPPTDARSQLGMPKPFLEIGETSPINASGRSKRTKRGHRKLKNKKKTRRFFK